MAKIQEFIKNQHEHISSHRDFVLARSKPEDAARSLLDRRAGKFTSDELKRFLDFCNMELCPRSSDDHTFKPNPTCTRFGPAFIGQNRALMLSDIEAFNFWVARLWFAGDSLMHVVEDFWSKDRVKGAGTALPTMLMYLKKPAAYTIWLPSLARGLSYLSGQKVPSRRTVSNYTVYTNLIDRYLRRPFDLCPQEIDYILSCIDRKG